MGNQVDLLVDLQAIDLQIRERAEAIDALTGQVAALQSDLAEQRKLLETARGERAALEGRRREIETVLGDEERKMKERRMRLNRIRNEKEAAALRREIELGKEAGQKLEEELLALFEQLDGVTAREGEVASACEVLAGREAEERARVDAEVGSLSGGLEEVRRRRDEIAAAVAADLRRQYETIAARRRGLAVVAVRAGTCQGCHMRVAPQLVNDIQRSQRVILCPSCHRILYWRPPAAGDEE